MLKSVVKVPYVLALGCGQHSFALKLIVFEWTFVDVAVELENPLLLGSALINPFKVVIWPLLLSLALQHVISKLSVEDCIMCVVIAQTIASAKFYFSLVILSIVIDKPAKAMGKSAAEGAFIKASIWVVIASEPVRFAIVPLSLKDDARPGEAIERVWLCDSSIGLKSTIALEFQRF